mgnify:CR=1 FL=1
MNVIIATTEKERQDAFFVRKIVFAEEQHVPLELEIDEYDEKATHFVLYEGDEPIGAARLRPYDDAGKIERVCILKSYRNRGLGKYLMEEIIACAKEKGFPKVVLHAQTQAIPFYEKLGFTVTSEEFMDAGIPHRAMEKPL